MPNDLHNLLADHQMFHSNLQIDSFILAKTGVTEYGIYKQCLRELHKRWRGLKQLYADRELLGIDIAEYESGVLDTDDFFETERQKVRLVQKRCALQELEATIADTEREFQRFYAHAKALKERIGELTEERRDALDLEMWQQIARHQLAEDLLVFGRTGPRSAELLQGLPVDSRIALYREAMDPKRLVQMVQESDTALPGVDGSMIDTAAIRALIEE